MKKNKGFTLIELLAVIVILAIIMVIAVPQILNVIDSSRTSAWKNSVKLVANSIQTNTVLFNPSSGSQTYTVAGLCSPGTGKTTKGEIEKITDIGDISSIECTGSGPYVFKLTGTNQFSGKYGIVTCTVNGTEAKCVGQQTQSNFSTIIE